MNRFLQILFLTATLIISGCSTVNTTNSQKPESEAYVFDDASDMNEEIVEETVPEPESAEIKSANKFIVQVGAFTTKARAEKFKRNHQTETRFEMNISYSQKVGLFVVQLPAFETRREAEEVRNSLWKKKNFKDAFILIKQ